MRVSIPARVWHDALDPLASGMEEALGIEPSRWVRRGRGASVEYELTAAEASELAEYLADRAEMLLPQSEPEDRSVLYAMRKAAGAIREAIR